MPQPTTPARSGDPTDDYHALSTTARSSMFGLSPPSRAQRDARDRLTRSSALPSPATIPARGRGCVYTDFEKATASTSGGICHRRRPSSQPERASLGPGTTSCSHFPSVGCSASSMSERRSGRGYNVIRLGGPAPWGVERLGNQTCLALGGSVRQDGRLSVSSCRR